MNLQALIAAGFTEEQAKKILEIHQQAINGNYVPKATFDAEREKLKTANDTIAERDKQITELGKFKGTAEELQTKVNTLTAANETAKQENETKIREMETQYAVKFALMDKVHNPDDIIPKLDLTKLTIKDGTVTAGLVEQLEAIKKTHAYYFKPEGDGAGDGTKGGDGQGQGQNGGLPAGWNLFGSTPAGGKSSETKDPAEEFGAALAKEQMQSADTSKFSYFK